MAEPEDFEVTNDHDEADDSGSRSDDFNDALKQGLRRAGMHWVRAGYEVLAGVGALLEELNQRSDEAQEPDESDDAERIELE